MHEASPDEPKKSQVSNHDLYSPFISEGFVSENAEMKNMKTIQILRDTGASQSLILRDILPLSPDTSTGTSVLIQGVELGYENTPLHKIYLKSNLVDGPVIVGIRERMPIDGISMILGNDLAGGKVVPNAVLINAPNVTDCVSNELEEEFPDIFPSCAVTRSMAKRMTENSRNCTNEKLLSPADDDKEKVSGDLENVDYDFNGVQLSKEQLIKDQMQDPELKILANNCLTEEESYELPVCYFLKDGVLMRKWRPSTTPVDDEWENVYQIVMPKQYRIEIIKTAHSQRASGHFGVTKTYNKIIKHFFWPGLKKSVQSFCRSCHVCQMIGKPNQKIDRVPLIPIPAFEEPFSRILIDCVGPLPRTRSGNQYLLTIMCAATRFPEAVPLRSISTPGIVKALNKFFAWVGVPLEIQSDQGSNFMSKIFKQVMMLWGTKHFKSSAYHPESQGSLERFHQTLKTMIKAYCYEFENDWDEGIHFLLFAVRESCQESLGFSPFELIFGHNVRGPLKVLKEKWLSSSSDSDLLTYVSTFRSRLAKACEIAKSNLKQSQKKMKVWYNRRAKQRSFEPNEKVLILFPVVGSPLQARYHGPYVVERKLNEVNYIIATPDRRKKRQLCHINMLKKYVEPVTEPSTEENEEKKVEKRTIALTRSTDNNTYPENKERSLNSDDNDGRRLDNSEILQSITERFQHLLPEQKSDLVDLFQEYDSYSRMYLGALPGLVTM